MSKARTDFFQLALTDPRYAPEAYEFLAQSMQFTQKMLDRIPPEASEDDQAPPPPECHVTAVELLEGIRKFGIEQFGMMGAVVFRSWGIESTIDFGRMVFRLIDAGIWHRSSTDQLEDFDDGFCFEKEFEQDFHIKWEEFS